MAEPRSRDTPAARLDVRPDPGSAPHDSAHTHVTGRSEYVDDRPMRPGELLCGLIYSPYARARLKRLDLSDALRIPGVVAAITAADVAHNLWGSIVVDQPLLVEEEAQYAGEVVAVIGAETPEALRRGLAAVRVEWTRLPAIRSIDEAITAERFIGAERRIERGDAGAALQAASHTLEGTLVIEGADHFYLESMAAVVYPGGDGPFEVHSSTQHPTETQHVVAEALGVPFSDVSCIARRLGGGFGGKESQAAPIAAYAALVARASGRPARLVLGKDDDMIVTGKRNPFQIRYRVGFDGDGRLLALQAVLHSDGGAYADLSTAIMERALLHCDNAYFIPNVEVRGRVCRTNHHPHTAFRGFGGPKGVALVESILEDVAGVVGRDALDVRRVNVYAPGRDETHYGQTVENNLLPSLFESLEERCEYRRRREEIRAWNGDPSNNPRGLSMTAVKFGISFTTRFLNQANALVNVHRDGTMQVSTGAVEMGQGVNSRIAALVAEQFGQPLDAVRMLATSTERNANTSPTAASSGTDLNGAAAVAACERIRGRLASLAARLRDLPEDAWPSRTAGLGTQPELTVADTPPPLPVRFEHGRVRVGDGDAAWSIGFAELVQEAHRSRISTCEYGHFATPHLAFDKIEGHGRAFLYFTQGVAASEVEIDRWTGEVKVRRVDLLMDLGRPVNHALDMGQVVGGFVQGMGWVTTEHLHYDENGLLVSHSPSTYKIPNVQDTPRIFNAELVFNEGNVANLRRTKAAGEPPLMLALSVWTAVRDAVSSARAVRVGRREPIAMAIPATAERVLRALEAETFARVEGGRTG
jgi:xanthine dehydrogenase large subunit